jgi:hypothetical protein
MIVTLLFTACLNLAEPSSCKEIAPPMDSGLSCPMQGEIVMQAWLSDHPKYHRLGGWKCRYGVPERKA